MRYNRIMKRLMQKISSRMRAFSVICALVMALAPISARAVLPEAHYAYVAASPQGYRIEKGRDALHAIEAKISHLLTPMAASMIIPLDVFGIANKAYSENPAFDTINSLAEYCLSHLLRGNYSFTARYAGVLSDAELTQLIYLPGMFFPHPCTIGVRWTRSGSMAQYHIAYYVDEDSWKQEKAAALRFVAQNYPADRTEREFLRAAHDHLANASAYDGALKGEEYDALMAQYGHFHGQQAGCALQCGKSLCAGYANALQLIALTAGIPVVNISGDIGGSPHEWNLVFPSDASGPRLIDVTWDDRSESVSYDYFWQENTAVDGRVAFRGSLAFLQYLGIM